MNFISHWRDDLSNEEYHSKRDFYSSSQLKVAISESLEAFHFQATKAKAKVQTDSMRIGTLIHSVVLEGEAFVNQYVVKPDFSSYGHANSNAHKAAKAEWMAAHTDKIIVSQDELDMTRGIYESILKHPDAMWLLKGNLFERSGFYRDSDTGIPLRIRYDSYDPKSRILVDLKSTQSVKRKEFSRQIMNYRYDLSLAMYGIGIESIDGKGPENHVFIAVEKTAPYHVAVYEMSRSALEIGRDDYRYALDRIKECQQSGIWPSYQSEMEEIDLPPYFEGMRNVR